ncbi:UbiA prenyltransferase family-domain-containing protein [Mycena capillaripes]|nr:UbiA prenyltransferase family-domain-containing protein [Mycena capillaripes]
MSSFPIFTNNFEDETHDCKGKDVRPALSLSFTQAMTHELRLFWAFTWRDWPASVIPGMMYAITALRCLPLPLSPAFAALCIGRAFVYLLLYIYSFTLSNQINGVAEDSIDKPDRPLPSGCVSLKEAYTRWYISTALLLFIGQVWGVLTWCLLWVILTIAHNFSGGGKHWFTRNLVFITLAVLCLLQPVWLLVTPMSTGEWQWLITLCVLSGVLFNIQDLRDVEGDLVAGRHTLPLAIGECASRYVLAALCCITPVVCWILDFLTGHCGCALALGIFYVAHRIVRGHSRDYDHTTYMIFCYIFAGCLAVHMIFPDTEGLGSFS